MKRNKSILTIIAILSLALSVIACNNSEAPKTEAKFKSTKISKGQAGKILSNYLVIKEALVKTDGEEAGAAAKKLITEFGVAQDKLAKEIFFDAQHIAETDNSDHQRDHFFTLSDNIYEMVKLTGVNNKVIYRQYCPMAFDNEGAYWLSSEKQVNNPYFGDRMLHCGSVKEILGGN